MPRVIAVLHHPPTPTATTTTTTTTASASSATTATAPSSGAAASADVIVRVRAWTVAHLATLAGVRSALAVIARPLAIVIAETTLRITPHQRCVSVM